MTVAEIRQYVEKLMYRALDSHNNMLAEEFDKEVEKNLEMQMDLKTWESLAKKSDELAEKYKASRRYYCLRTLSASNLRDYLLDAYKEQKSEERKKIQDQFRNVIKRLKEIRSPKKALEFVKICGIELPKEVEEKPLDIDPEFIKSMLPKNKLLK